MLARVFIFFRVLMCRPPASFLLIDRLLLLFRGPPHYALVFPLAPLRMPPRVCPPLVTEHLLTACPLAFGPSGLLTLSRCSLASLDHPWPIWSCAPVCRPRLTPLCLVFRILRPRASYFPISLPQALLLVCITFTSFSGFTFSSRLLPLLCPLVLIRYIICPNHLIMVSPDSSFAIHVLRSMEWLLFASEQGYRFFLDT